MDDRTLAREVLAAIRRDLAPWAPDDETVVLTGFRSPSGREIPLVVERADAASGVVFLSDGGETWWELVGEGFVDGRPVGDDRRRLERIAKLYGTNWAPRECAFRGAATVATAATVARGILSSTIALDGWRAFAPPVVSQVQRVSDVIPELVKMALEQGWTTKRKHHVLGVRTHREWLAPLWLERGKRGVAVMSFNDKPKAVVDRAIAWYLDTETPAIAMIPEDAVEQAEHATELVGHVTFVPRRVTGTAREVIARASRLLPSAA